MSTEVSRERALFEALIGLPEAEREAALTARCADDAALAARLRKLLAAHAKGEALERPVIAPAAHDDPERIGAYEIVGRVGEGGMGVVYLADQLTPVRRRVALKVVKPGMDSREVVARFEAERQALALMTHPNIARIIDGGATPDGRPYFVMEHVPGAPITRWCDERRLGLPERLRLFVAVCNAVQHAHQKGVIHRDLKPSNVLVTELDGRPTPKVIDFGIAKAIGQPLTEGAARTRVGHMIGTPDYMSPEQFDWASQDVDTRADVYALGVLLHELLSGALPFDFQARKLGLADIERAVREQDPPTPSMSARRATPEVFAARGARDANDLADWLTGDLDWVVTRALAKEREQRYASAQELANDLLRHLRDEPVLAGPPSGLHVLRKFARRHVLAVSVLTVAFGLSLAFAGMMWTQMQATAHERDRANLEAAKAREVAAFLTRMFEQADPASGGGVDLTARQILDVGARRVRVELASQPELRQELLHIIGRAYHALGLYPESRGAIEEWLADARAAGDREDEFRARAILAALDASEGKVEGARDAMAVLLADVERAFGPEADLSIEVRTDLAEQMRELGQLDESGELLRANRAILERTGRISGEHYARVRLHESYVLIDRGDLAAAVQPVAEAVALAERMLGPRHIQTLIGRARQGQLAMLRGDFVAAEQVFRTSLLVTDELYGPGNRESAAMLANIGFALQQQDKLDAALDALGRAHTLLSTLLGADHPSALTALNNVAFIKQQRGDLAGARADFEAVLSGRRAKLGAEHPETATALTNLGSNLKAAGDIPRAERLTREGLGIFERALGPTHWRTANARRLLGELLETRGQLAAAEREVARALTDLTAALGAEHARVQTATKVLERIRAKRSGT
jgi:serine/threonine protein kinase/tetratricopeptide (TPR) repeat protein